MTMSHETDTNLEYLKSWTGRRESVTDIAGPAPARGLSATLDRAEIDWSEGDVLPLGWQWIYLHSIVRQSELGPDGHPKRGSFLPPVPLPRRMIAGGRMQLLEPMRVGDRLRRDSEIADVAIKEGRTGRLVFVTVRHEIHSGQVLAVKEEQTIVYRDRAPASKSPTPGATGPPTGAGPPAGPGRTATWPMRPGGAQSRPIRSCCSAFRR